MNYIVEAVRTEKMPFEKERLRAVLDMLPKEVVAWRYRTLGRACEDARSQNGNRGAGRNRIAF